MTPTEITCSKCKKMNVVEIAKMGAVEDLVPGKDLGMQKLPLYFCRDCNEVIN